MALEPNIRPDQDASKIAHWDPDAWVEGDRYYALSGGSPGSGKPPTLFKSTDLTNWDYLGCFSATTCLTCKKTKTSRARISSR